MARLKPNTTAVTKDGDFDKKKVEIGKCIECAWWQWPETATQRPRCLQMVCMTAPHADGEFYQDPKTFGCILWQE